MIKTILKILYELREHIGKFHYYSLYLIVTILAIILSLEPLFFGKIISELETYYKTNSFNVSFIFQIVLFWLSFVILANIARYFIRQRAITTASVADYKKSIDKYADKVLNMSMRSYLSRKMGSIYKIIDRGTDDKHLFVYRLYEVFVFEIVGVISIVVILFMINVKMAIISLIFLPLMMYLGRFFVIHTAPRQRKLSEQWESIFHVIANALSNFGLFKTLQLKKRFLKDIQSQTDINAHRQVSLNRSWNISDIYTNLLIMFSRILVLAFGIYFIKQGELTLSELFVIFTYIEWVYAPIGVIFKQGQDLVRLLTEVQRMYDEVGSMELEVDMDTGKRLQKIDKTITFQGVGFSYVNKRKIIKKLDFVIKPSQKIAFVGNTGSGKSTIINLLLRFWEPNSGKILLNNTNISEYSKKSLRSHIGIVSQDNSLFNLSIKENLLFAKPKATKNELKEALKNAQADFVFDLENGIDTVIGERGLKLSGGEKQRISIARLFLKNPSILVLDEATSALDNKTEKLIQKALDKLMEGKTTIIVAHRLSTIQNVDKIYMLESGEIIEEGNYGELIKKGGKFAELANPEHLILN